MICKTNAMANTKSGGNAKLASLADKSITEIIESDLQGATSVGEYAFYNCDNLTSVRIANSVESIGECAFRSCDNLTNITIPNSIISISDSAFEDCDRLTYYEDDYAYYLGNEDNNYVVLIQAKDTSMQSCTINENTKVIYKSAFSNCSDLRSIKIPDSVTNIGWGAFSGCNTLQNITLPFVGRNFNGATNTHFGYIFGASDYEENSIHVPTSLETVVVTGATSIDEYAFAGCDHVTEINVENINVPSMGDSAFLNCSRLKRLKLPFVGEGSLGTKNTNFGYIFGASNSSHHQEYVPASLEQVVITGGTYISDNAFYNCSSLTEVTIPTTVQSIGINAFTGCTSLKSITLPFVGARLDDTTKNTHFGYIFGANSYSYNDDYVPTTLKTVVITGGTSISDWAFAYCDGLTSITIPNSVTSIGERAFADCTAEIIWGDNPSITTIGQYAFASYNGETLTIPNSVLTIDSYAVSNCTSLTEVTIGSGVTSISNFAFEYCSSLIKINYNATTCEDLSSRNYVFSGAGQNGNGITVMIGANVTRIPEYLFCPYGDNTAYAPNITTVDFVDASICESIGGYAFRNCNSLKSVTIPDSVTSIGGWAFSNCSSLTYNKYDNADYLGNESNKYLALIDATNTSITSCTIHSNTKVIADRAFGGCSSLTEVTIPDSVTSIGNYAFHNCTSLTSITIGSGVTSIGDCVFASCISLTSITIGSGVTSIGYRAFYNCSSLTDVYYEGSATDWGNITISGGNDNLTGATIYYYVEDESDVPTDGGNYWHYVNGIPTVWAIIDAGASVGLTYKLSDDQTYHTVTGIGTCTDTDLVISSTYNSKPVKEIGDYAFSNCSNLTSIIIPNSVTSIGAEAFAQCDGLTEVIIPNSVTDIGAGAFYSCDNLLKAVIPSSVTSMGAQVFNYCFNLTVYCEAAEPGGGWDGSWNPIGSVYYYIENENDLPNDGGNYWHYVNGIPTVW